MSWEYKNIKVLGVFFVFSPQLRLPCWPVEPAGKHIISPGRWGGKGKAQTFPRGTVLWQFSLLVRPWLISKSCRYLKVVKFSVWYSLPLLTCSLESDWLEKLRGCFEGSTLVAFLLSSVFLLSDWLWGGIVSLHLPSSLVVVVLELC